MYGCMYESACVSTCVCICDNHLPGSTTSTRRSSWFHSARASAAISSNPRDNGSSLVNAWVGARWEGRVGERVGCEDKGSHLPTHRDKGLFGTDQRGGHTNGHYWNTRLVSKTHHVPVVFKFTHGRFWLCSYMQAPRVWCVIRGCIRVEGCV